MSTFRGTGVAMITPFRTDSTVDLDQVRKLVRYWIDGGLDYLVILGTTGEAATLNAAEKDHLIETVLSTANGQIPIVLGSGGNNTRSIASQIAHFEKQFQFDGILSVSPYYNKPSQEGIYQHYRDLARGTDLPIILYNVPGRTASNMEAHTTLRLANDYSNIVAVKEASGNLEQCMRIIAEKPKSFALLSGDDSLTLPLISIGAEGVISVSANAFPAQFSNMVRFALDGDFVQAQQLHYHLFPFIEMNFKEGNPAGIKALMELMGLGKAHLRLPLVNVSQDLRNQMESALNVLMQRK